MSCLEIQSFGPIGKLKMNLNKNINLVIGPQASGKSTIGKMLYFCKKVHDYYLDFILQDRLFIQTHPNELYINFLKYIRKNFMGCFGTTRHMSSFVVSYSYGNNNSLTISLREGYAYFKFSNKLESKIRESLQSVHSIYMQNQAQENMDYMAKFTSKINLKEEIKDHFSELADDFFGHKMDVIYIPAGRSLLSVLSDQVDVIDTAILDLPMKDFIERIRMTRTRFGTKLDGVVEDYLKTVQGQIKNADIDMAKALIKQVLKAEYVNDTDGEKFYFDDQHWVKLIYGSSGQQESLWILLLLFIIILENKKAYVILEEPEAHLYPVDQKIIVELIALTMNSTNSKFFITTHSPYILSSANLLIQSALIENRVETRGEETVIKRQFRIAPEKIAAYKISEEKEFRMNNIIDDEFGTIRSLEIDSVSEGINALSEKLDSLEMKYDM